MNHQTPTRTVFNPDVIRRMSRFKSALLNRVSIAARSPLRSLADNGEKLKNRINSLWPKRWLKLEDRKEL